MLCPRQFGVFILSVTKNLWSPYIMQILFWVPESSMLQNLLSKSSKSNEIHTYEYGSGFSLLNPTGCILKIQKKYINSKTIMINKTMFLQSANSTHGNETAHILSYMLGWSQKLKKMYFKKCKDAQSRHFYSTQDRKH